VVFWAAAPSCSLFSWELCFQTILIYVFLKVRDRVSHPKNATGKIIILLIVIRSLYATHTHTYIDTYIHKYIHNTYIHTYIHTYTYTRAREVTLYCNTYFGVLHYVSSFMDTAETGKEAKPNLILTTRHSLQAKNMMCHWVKCVNIGTFLQLHTGLLKTSNLKFWSHI
jgi:hypothetical protein